jgi:hypothetical protein
MYLLTLLKIRCFINLAKSTDMFVTNDRILCVLHNSLSGYYIAWHKDSLFIYTFQHTHTYIHTNIQQLNAGCANTRI